MEISENIIKLLYSSNREDTRIGIELLKTFFSENWIDKIQELDSRKMIYNAHVVGRYGERTVFIWDEFGFETYYNEKNKNT